ncbi:MAG TPA: amidohydrolase family protein [Burkholderiaceae bacterium]|nr:amidohydrolase family protein [Burkholderiaceae bacterium]
MNPRFEAVRGKIIDFRLRPPTGPYRVFFTPALVERLARLWGDKEMPGSYALSLEDRPDADERALAALIAEMDAAGIRLGVMNGRHSPNRAVPVHISDDYLHELEGRLDGRMASIAGVDLDLPMDEILGGIERAITRLGMRGVCVEPGFARQPMYAEDERLMPIYQKVSDLGVPLLFMSGPLSGPDNSFTDPVHFERVARLFPKMPVVLGHGAYPYVNEAIALAYKSEATGVMNVYLSPDVYMFTPGATAFIEAVNMMPDRMLFGSAYAFCSVGTAVSRTMDLAISDEVMAKYMYGNAQRLLGL